VVSVLDSGAEGPEFKSQSRRCRVTVLGKLFTPIVLLFTKQQNGSSLLKGCEGNCRPGGKQWQPTAGFMTHVTCRLTAKNRDQLRNHTLGNRVWAFFSQWSLCRATLQRIRPCMRRRKILKSGGGPRDQEINSRSSETTPGADHCFESAKKKFASGAGKKYLYTRVDKPC